MGKIGHEPTLAFIGDVTLVRPLLPFNRPVACMPERFPPSIDALTGFSVWGYVGPLPLSAVTIEMIDANKR
jgi:hypothetical protein